MPCLVLLAVLLVPACAQQPNMVPSVTMAPTSPTFLPPVVQPAAVMATTVPQPMFQAAGMMTTAVPQPVYPAAAMMTTVPAPAAPASAEANNPIVILLGTLTAIVVAATALLGAFMKFREAITEFITNHWQSLKASVCPGDEEEEAGDDDANAPLTQVSRDPDTQGSENPGVDFVVPTVGAPISNAGKEGIIIVLEEDPRHAEAWHQLGHKGGGIVKGKTYTEKDCWIQGLQIQESSADWHNLSNQNGGTVNGRKYTKQACCQRSLELDPENAVNWNNYASKFTKLVVNGKEYTKVQCFQRAIELDPSAVAWGNLGMEGGGVVNGRRYTARQCYDEALKLAPYDANFDAAKARLRQNNLPYP